MNYFIFVIVAITDKILKYVRFEIRLQKKKSFFNIIHLYEFRQTQKPGN